MAEATKQVRVDDRRRCRRIAAIGGEDRALLRSNPSARSDAGTGAGVQTTSRLPPTPTCSGPKAQNLGGPGAEPPQRLKPRTVCHLARSPGPFHRRRPAGGKKTRKKDGGPAYQGLKSLAKPARPPGEIARSHRPGDLRVRSLPLPREGEGPYSMYGWAGGDHDGVVQTLTPGLCPCPLALLNPGTLNPRLS